MNCNTTRTTIEFTEEKDEVYLGCGKPLNHRPRVAHFARLLVLVEHNGRPRKATITGHYCGTCIEKLELKQVVNH